MDDPLILVCSLSRLRQKLYADALTSAGYDVELSDNAMSCLEQALERIPTAMVVETSTLWGGAEGLLSVMHDHPRLAVIPVIVICVNFDADQLFKLSRYKIASLHFDWPSGNELLTALAGISKESHANGNSLTTPCHST